MSSTEIELQSDAEIQLVSTPSTPAFFPVSLTKFFLLSLCTLGLYQVYWFYKNWYFVKRREKSDILPALRSLFGVIFCYWLLKRVSEQSVASGGKPLPAGLLAICWIVTNLLWRLPDPYWLVSFLAIIFLLPVQASINSMNARLAPDHDKNNHFSGWNIFGLIVGGLFFLLAVIGTFLPATQV